MFLGDIPVVGRHADRWVPLRHVLLFHNFSRHLTRGPSKKSDSLRPGSGFPKITSLPRPSSDVVFRLGDHTTAVLFKHALGKAKTRSLLITLRLVPYP